METINYLGWELDLSIRLRRFFKYCLEVWMNKNQWNRLSWKTACSMILANNNTKWVSSQLFGCGRTKFDPLGRGHFHHLVFITELIQVLPVGHMYPLLTLYSLFCGTKSQRNGWRFLKNFEKKDIILRQHRRLDVVFTLCELKPDSISSRSFPFWFGM